MKFALFYEIPVARPWNAESDGLVVLRALRPASRLVIPTPAAQRRPSRPLRAPFAIVLALVIPVAFLANVWTGFFTLGLFGLAYVGERR